MTELEWLQNEINGKEVVWCNPSWGGIEMEALLIWPPNSIDISVKPYGYEPEELYIIFNGGSEVIKKGAEAVEIEHFEASTFCLAEHHADGEHYMPQLRNLAAIPIGGRYIFTEVTGHLDWNPSHPSCPHG